MRRHGKRPLRSEARQSRQQAQTHHHRRGTGLAGASAAATLGELGYKVKCFCFQDSPAGLTPSPHRAASTPPKIIRTTATASFASSTTPLKAATSAPAKGMSIGWPRSVSNHRPVRRPGRSVRPRIRRLATTAPLAAPRFRAPSMPVDRPASNFCSAPTRPSSARCTPALSRCSPARRCSTSSSSTARPAASSPAISLPARSTILRRCGHSRHRRIRQRLLPFHQRQGLERHRDLAGA